MSSTLITHPNLDEPDEFYEALIESHRGLSMAHSHHLNAHLVLLLANHIGRTGVLKDALEAGRASISVDGRDAGTAS